MSNRVSSVRLFVGTLSYVRDACFVTCNAFSVPTRRRELDLGTPEQMYVLEHCLDGIAFDMEQLGWEGGGHPVGGCR